jgi:hypothetical protein
VYVLRQNCRAAGWRWDTKKNNLQLRCVIDEINSATAEQIIQEDMLFLEHNDQIMNIFQNVDINNDTLQTLIFIAGYVGYKVTRKNNCQECMDSFISNKKIIYDLPATKDDYFCKLDRGGLKYPSEFSLTIATSVYQIFETVTSEPFEFSFRNAKNKKGILNLYF